MTYKEFKEKYSGKVTDYDGYYGGQCWDLAQYYFVKVLNLPASVLSGCGLVSNMLKGKKRQLMDKYFDEVKISEMQQGDVAIWEYGHIAIFDSKKGNKNYYFSQNPNLPKVMAITTGGVHAFRLKGTKKVENAVSTSSKKGTLTVNSGSWNVRKGAGTNYAVVKVVKGGTKLNYYGTSNGWYKIDSGYISPKAVKVNSTTSQPKVTYLSNKTYKGSSIVDALNQIKVNSSFSYRTKLANKNGIKLYIGSASQNTKLLNLLKQGKLIKA